VESVAVLEVDPGRPEAPARPPQRGDSTGLLVKAPFSSSGALLLCSSPLRPPSYAAHSTREGQGPRLSWSWCMMVLSLTRDGGRGCARRELVQRRLAAFGRRHTSRDRLAGQLSRVVTTRGRCGDQSVACTREARGEVPAVPMSRKVDTVTLFRRPAGEESWGPSVKPRGSTWRLPMPAPRALIQSFGL